MTIEMIFKLLFTGEIVIGFLIWVHIAIQHSIARKTLDVSLLNVQLNTNINPSIDAMLEEFIANCFNEYIFLNAGFIEHNFIAEDTEKKMSEDLSNIVSDRLSSTMYKQISVYYNEKAIPTIISNKIFTIVTAYVIENNKPKGSDKISED